MLNYVNLCKSPREMQDEILATVESLKVRSATNYKKYVHNVAKGFIAGVVTLVCLIVLFIVSGLWSLPVLFLLFCLCTLFKCCMNMEVLKTIVYFCCESYAALKRNDINWYIKCIEQSHVLPNEGEYTQPDYLLYLMLVTDKSLDILLDRNNSLLIVNKEGLLKPLLFRAIGIHDESPDCITFTESGMFVGNQNKVSNANRKYTYNIALECRE